MMMMMMMMVFAPKCLGTATPIRQTDRRDFQQVKHPTSCEVNFQRINFVFRGTGQHYVYPHRGLNPSSLTANSPPISDPHHIHPHILPPSRSEHALVTGRRHAASAPISRVDG